MLLSNLYRAAFAHVRLNAPGAHPLEVLALVHKLVQEWAVDRRE